MSDSPRSRSARRVVAPFLTFALAFFAVALYGSAAYADDEAVEAVEADDGEGDGDEGENRGQVRGHGNGGHGNDDDSDEDDDGNVAAAGPAGPAGGDGVSEDNDADGVPNTPDPAGDADNQHPSGNDKHADNGMSGHSQSDPDGTENGGADKPGGTGGVDQLDQDFNNGCGNDDDFEDDNNGNCGGVARRPEDEPGGDFEEDDEDDDDTTGTVGTAGTATDTTGTLTTVGGFEAAETEAADVAAAQIGGSDTAVGGVVFSSAVPRLGASVGVAVLGAVVSAEGAAVESGPARVLGEQEEARSGSSRGRIAGAAAAAPDDNDSDAGFVGELARTGALLSLAAMFAALGGGAAYRLARRPSDGTR